MDAQAMRLLDESRRLTATAIALAILGTLAALSSIVLLLVLRRMAGALIEPLTDGGLTLLGATLVAVVVLVRCGWSAVARCDADNTWAGRLFWLPSLLLVSMGLVVCIPGTPQAGGAVLWGLIVLEELWTLSGCSPGGGIRLRIQRSARRDNSRPTVDRLDRVELDPPGEALDEPAGRDDLRVDPPQQPSPHIPLPRGAALNVWQQATRWREAGEEIVQGVARAEFAPGARLAIVHVGFCPPLESVPQLVAAAIDGPPATVKLAARLAHGIRLEVKLRAVADQPACVLVEFTARCPLREKTAATTVGARISERRATSV